MTRLLWALAILTFPFNRSVLLWQSTPLAQENFNPYTSFSLHGSEILLALALVSAIVETLKNPKKYNLATASRWLGGAFLVSLYGALIAQDHLSALFNGVHLVAAAVVVVFYTQQVIPVSTMKKLFLGSVAIQVILGITQVTLQHSIGLSIVGESVFYPDLANVAKVGFAGGEWVRAYGTFPHANLLAGYCLVAFVFSLEKKTIPQYIAHPLQFLLLLGLLFSFSQGAWLGLFVAIVLFKNISLKKAVGGVGLLVGGWVLWKGKNIFESESIRERLDTLWVSTNMFLHSPQGVGFHQFTNRMQEFTALKLQPWQFQPTHNVYFLALNEWGFALVWLVNECRKKAHSIRWNTLNKALLGAVGVTALFDHYFFSLYQGLMLSALVIASVITPPK